MADTGGIAALLKALNENPSLGSGLRNQGVNKANGVARAQRAAASSAVSSTSAATGTSFADAVTSTSAAQTGAAALRAARNAMSSAAASTGPLPKVLGAGGAGYNPKAPRGTYLNMVV